MTVVGLPQADRLTTTNAYWGFNPLLRIFIQNKKILYYRYTTHDYTLRYKVMPVYVFLLYRFFS